MQTTKIIRLNSFPDDDFFWRVDWIDGYVSKLGEKEPQLTAYLTKLKYSKAGKFYPLDPLNLTKEHRKAIVGAGHQTLVNIGSVWRNKNNVSDKFNYEIFDCKVDTADAKSLSFQDRTLMGKRILTPVQYPVGPIFDQIKSSGLIALPYDGDEYGLVIPISEIIRFYYLITTPMALAVYLGRFEELTKDKVTIDAVNKNVEFTYNWGVSERNALNIGRHATSPLMQARVKEIHQWAQINSHNEFETPTSYKFFPFEGVTHLHFEGMRIRGDDNIERILCTKLVSCTGPFYFDAIKAITLKPKQDDLGGDGIQSIPLLWSLDLANPENNFDPDETPSNEHHLSTFVNVEKRFLKATYIQIENTKKTYIPEKKKRVQKEIIREDLDYSTSPGTYGESGTKGASIETESPEVPNVIPPRLQSFLNIIGELRNLGYSVITKPVKVPEEKSKNCVVENMMLGEEIITQFYKSSEKKRNWVDLRVGDDIYRRGLIVAEVIKDSKIWYLFELQPDIEYDEDNVKGYSVLLRHKIDGKKYTNNELFTFMEECVSNEGWPKLSEARKLDSVQTRLKHSSSLKERIVFQMNALCKQP